MPSVLLLQLPLPQLNYGRRTGNIPLGAACLQIRHLLDFFIGQGHDSFGLRDSVQDNSSFI